MRLKQKRQEIYNKFGDTLRIRISSTEDIPPPYSSDDEKKIIQLKSKGKSNQQIANCLNRSYWGIVDKIRRMREKGVEI